MPVLTLIGIPVIAIFVGGILAIFYSPNARLNSSIAPSNQPVSFWQPVWI
jgi:hypothetical protein